MNEHLDAHHDSPRLDYQTKPKFDLDWQKLVTISVMIGSATAAAAIGLWAIFIPHADPNLIFPLIACLSLYAIGSIWWLLIRKGLS